VTASPAHLLASRVRAQAREVLAELRAGERGALYAMLGRLFTTAASFALIAIAAAVLSPEEQGFFFTFLSMLALQAFLELGLGAVLTQYVAHEWAHLTAGDDGVVTGPPGHIARLGSLVHLARRWYLGVGVALVAVLGAGGFAFLSLANTSTTDWQLAWWLLVLAQAAYVQTVPLSGLLEGAGRVATNQRALLSASFFGTSVGIVGMLLGAGLLALPAMVATRALTANALLRAAASDLLAVRANPSAGRIGWREEIWPLQWRLATSWLAGFAMFQSFTPIAFAVSGAVFAGQVGIAVQGLLVVQGLGMSWVLAAQPRMGVLAAQNRLDELRALASQTLGRSVATAGLAAFAALLLVSVAYLLDRSYAERFGDLFALVTFLGCGVVLQVSNAETAAVRFRKREPFVIASIACAALVIASNLVLGTLLGARGMALGFAAVLVCVLLPWVHVLFRRHTEVVSLPTSPSPVVDPSAL
jgi:hypothetical protein